MKRKINKKVPSGALSLMEGKDRVKFLFSDPGDDGTEPRLTSFHMVGYSGQIIPNHWYWGDLVIDLSGMKFPKDKYPILKDHDTDQELAFSSKPNVTDEGLVFTDKEVTFLDNEKSQTFINNSKAGFPYQASIRAEPTRIITLLENEETTVNGFVFKGPGTIWKESTFQECSICVFGYDRQTSAEAFSDDQSEISVVYVDDKVETTENKDGAFMDPKEFKAKHPDTFSAIKQEIVTEMQNEFKAKTTEMETALSAAQSENKELALKVKSTEEANTQFSERVTSLEKAQAKAEMLSQAAQAQCIFSDLLADSGIPKDLHEKVSAMVSFSKFRKDGVFDSNAFSEAAKAEIADWSGKIGAIAKSTSVQGFSASETDTLGEEDLSKEDEDTIALMARGIRNNQFSKKESK